MFTVRKAGCGLTSLLCPERVCPSAAVCVGPGYRQLAQGSYDAVSQYTSSLFRYPYPPEGVKGNTKNLVGICVPPGVNASVWVHVA